MPESEARQFVRLIQCYDLDDQLDLQMGGDGDAGELLVEIIEDLIDAGHITLIMNPSNER